MGTVAGVTMGRMLARGVALLPGEGLGLLLGDEVLGVGRMLAVGGSERLELMRKQEKLQLIFSIDILYFTKCASVFVFTSYLPLS